MNSANFFGAFGGMLNVASRREMDQTAATSKVVRRRVRRFRIF